MTMEKEMSEHRKSLKRAELIIGSIAVGLMLIGAMIVLIGAMKQMAYLEIQADDHMTDDSIPYRDLDNATYTWELSELEDLFDDHTNLLIFGAVFVGLGYVAVLVMGATIPSGTKAHKLYCDGTGEKTHCPECGLKLSKLEKK